MFIQIDLVDRYGNTIHRFRDGRDFETREEAEDALREQGYWLSHSGWWIKSDHWSNPHFMAKVFAC